MIQNSSTHFYRRSYITGDSFPISDITLNNRLIYFQHLSIVIKGLSANFVIFAEISPYGAYEAGVKDFVITTGRFADVLKDYLKKLSLPGSFRFVHNEAYAETNSYTNSSHTI